MLQIFKGFENGVEYKALDEYKEFIYQKLDLSFFPTIKNLNDDVFNAIPGYCHDNVDEYCALNSSCVKLTGWICVDVEGDFSKIILASHSIIQTGDNKFLDITPAIIPNKYKFISSFLSNFDYDKLIKFLYESKGETTIHMIFNK